MQSFVICRYRANSPLFWVTLKDIDLARRGQGATLPEFKALPSTDQKIDEVATF